MALILCKKQSPLYVLAALVLCGCSQADPAAKQYQIEFQKHLAAVKHQLKDGESARFDKLFLSKQDDGTALCGEVNAKNAFGAYVGFSRFLQVGGSAMFEASLGEAGMDAAWRVACGNKVYSPPAATPN